MFAEIPASRVSSEDDVSSILSFRNMMPCSESQPAIRSDVVSWAKETYEVGLILTRQ